MSEKKYYLYVKRRKVEVSEEIYTSYYVEVEKLKYEKRKERRNSVNSYHALDTNDQLGEAMLEDKESEPIEEIVTRKILIEQLKKSLELLSHEEMELIQGLFYMGLSERELTALTGIPQKTINDRKHRVLKKLKYLIEE